MDMRVYIVGETLGGRLTEETMDLASFVHSAYGRMPDACFLPSCKGDDAAHELAGLTGSTVHLLRYGDDLCPPGRALAEKIAAIIGEGRPSAVFLAQRFFGLELAPMIALLLDAEILTGVVAASGWRFTRQVYSGRFVEHIEPARDRVVCTVFTSPRRHVALEHPSRGRVIVHEAPPADDRARFAGILEPAVSTSPLPEAEVIVSAGRGLGGKENLHLVEELASLFPRSAVGASRGACDLGWLDYSRQIGTTGLSVSPRLYIACGISGAVQHTAGIRGAQTVIAVNIDEQAPIFNVAHIHVVEDLKTFLPALIDEMRKAMAGRNLG